MSSRRNLLGFGSAVFLLNLVAAAAAVILNWPSQFGGVGTAAGDELLSRGTAISAPVLPIAILVVSLLLVWRNGRWLTIGVVGISVTAALFLIGAIGELTAEETADTPKSVLVAAGVVWTVIAVSLLGLAFAAFIERRRLVH